MKNTIKILAAAFVIFWAQQVSASMCYSPQEFEAEQGLRIHSELMVIGLTCMKMPQGQQTYMKYDQFTRKNQALISTYESSMISFYRKRGDKAPEKSLHTLRTNLANGISKHAIEMSTASFCKQFTSRVDQALAMDTGKLKKWAQQVWPATPTTLPMCRKV